MWDEVVSKSNIKAVRRSIAYMSEDCEMDDTSVERRRVRLFWVEYGRR